MTELEKMLLHQFKQLANDSAKQFEELRRQLQETNQRLLDMTKNYQSLQEQLTLLSKTEAELLRELKS